MRNKIFGCIAMILIAGACAENSATTANKKLASDMYEAFNAHDWTKMASFYHAEADFLDPSFGPEFVKQTREQTAAKYTELAGMMPDLKDDIVGMYAENDKVIVEFVATGTMPDSTVIRLPIVSILTIKDGLITKDATYYDNAM